ncbi:hypothetical protein R3P38DRAFT_2790798 [Favolaschia claudopus]|uniref:Uncharacterized protein n=1 Tax=Favolaschia claudopus TaxID=2862362 RepID=A0AAW0AIP3_9AGAR
MLAESPPDSPSKTVELAQELSRELLKSDARIAIQKVRIRELQNAAPGRNKQGDRRRPSGTSRFYDQDVLNEMREQRDEKDRKKGRGGGRGRGRGGQSSGRTLRDITNQRDSDEDSQSSSGSEEGMHSESELLESFNGELPQIVSDPPDDDVDDGDGCWVPSRGKRKASEPLVDEDSGRPKWKTKKPTRLNL